MVARRALPGGKFGIGLKKSVVRAGGAEGHWKTLTGVRRAARLAGAVAGRLRSICSNKGAWSRNGKRYADHALPSSSSSFPAVRRTGPYLSVPPHIPQAGALVPLMNHLGIFRKVFHLK